jgi:hypothetical protein
VREAFERLTDISRFQRPNKRRNTEEAEDGVSEDSTTQINGESPSYSPLSEPGGAMANSGRENGDLSRKSSKRAATGLSRRRRSSNKTMSPAANLPLHTFELSHNTFIGEANFSSSAHSSPRPAEFGPADQAAIQAFGTGASVFFSSAQSPPSMPLPVSVAGTGPSVNPDSVVDPQTQILLDGSSAGGMPHQTSLHPTQMDPVQQMQVPPGYMPFVNGYLSTPPMEPVYNNDPSASANTGSAVLMPRYGAAGTFDSGIWGASLVCFVKDIELIKSFFSPMQGLSGQEWDFNSLWPYPQPAVPPTGIDPRSQLQQQQQQQRPLQPDQHELTGMQHDV